MQNATHVNQTEERVVAARVPVEVAERLARLAAAGDRSISGEIRRALREHIEAEGSETR